MKKSILTVVLMIALAITTTSNAQVGIGVSTANINPSAQLDVNSTTKGLLPPRMTTTQRDAISSPASGLVIFNTTTNSLEYRSSTSWVQLTTGGVPYTGASQAVNLGAYALTADSLITKGFRATGTAITDSISTRAFIASGNIKVNSIYIGRGNGNSFTNTAFGGDAFPNGFPLSRNSLSGGFWNTAIGISALGKNTTGGNNTAVGANVMNSNTAGSSNTAIGKYVLAFNTSGSNNTGIGFHSMFANTTGGSNTASGYNSLLNNTTGYKNTAMGDSSLLTNTTGSNNTALGCNADVSSDALSNATAIGNGAIVNASNTIQLGNSNVTMVNTSGAITAQAVTTTSDVRLKRNIVPLKNSIGTLMHLNPVSYEKKNSLNALEYNIKENGFIAQELKLVMPNLVVEGTDKDKLLSVNYTALIPVLTKAIQEQQKEIEELKKLVNTLLKNK